MSFTLVKSPAVWNIPSSEPACIEAELYLQLATKELNKSESKTRFTTVENKYCTHQLTVTHANANSLPVLIDAATVVPATQVITYLKNNFYNFDESLPVETHPDLATYRIALEKLYVAIEFLNTIDNVDTVYAKGANWFVRKFLQSRHSADVAKLAHAAHIFTHEDALLAVSRILYIFALKMETAEYLFGSLSSIDIGLAAAVLVLIASSPMTAALVYNYFPALAASAHRIAAASELPSYTFTPDLHAISRSYVVKVNALIQVCTAKFTRVMCMVSVSPLQSLHVFSGHKVT